MKLLTLLVTGAFLAGGFGAHATFYEQQAVENAHPQAQTINQLTATHIALDRSKGGLVKKTQRIEEKGNRKYKISLLNQEKEVQVVIDASTGEIISYNEEIQNQDNITKASWIERYLLSVKKLLTSTTCVKSGKLL